MLRKFVPVCCAAIIGLSILPGGGSVTKADVLYNSFSNPRYDSTDPSHTGGAYGYNPGFATDIAWDDIPITTGGNPLTQAIISQVKFGIGRGALAGPVTIDAYWAPMVADNGANRGGSSPSDSPYDGPDEDPGTPVHIGQIQLLASVSQSPTIQSITFGDGINTLFSTGPLDFHYSSTVGYFMLGLKISDTSNANSWALASGTNNLNVVWDDFQDDSPSSVDEFAFPGTDLGGVPFQSTLSAQVIGTVPEPASLSLLAIGGLAALRRRRVIA